jgi:glycosyltransferase involved in cell wall biosynthesis
MLVRLGIGIITYNRCALLASTIEAVRRYTRHDDCLLVIADDGSTDNTLALARRKQVQVISGINMGIAWNKNRALYSLAYMLRCDNVILLEDDVHPTQAGWEQEWISAAQRHGHVNYAGAWFSDAFISGVGTAEDPILSRQTTGQCASYSSEAVGYAGYYDSRFHGYGHEHVEHTARMVRCGYGGVACDIDGKKTVLFKLLRGALNIVDTPSFANESDVTRNLEVANQIMGDETYRAPWRNQTEMRQFRSEISNGLAASVDAHRLRPGERMRAIFIPMIRE